MPEVPFFVPWITEEDKSAVVEALSSRWLTGGPLVSKFEKIVAEYVGVKYAVAVSSCTAALHLVMRALAIGPGDEVIIPDLTFAATANSVLYCGARPVLCDVDPVTFNISPTELGKKITKRTKGIITVHYAGLPCEMSAIVSIAERERLFVVEDCAHSLGAVYMGKKTGSIGVAGCFSFYPTKNITTMEGGMITTNNENLAKKARLLRSQGSTKNAFERERERNWFYDIVELGYNYRLTEIQAALGISQIKRIDEANGRRIKAAQEYGRRLANVNGIVLPPPLDNHVFHMYPVRIMEEKYRLSRDQVYRYLSSRGIEPSVHYTPLHLMSLYKQILGDRKGQFPVSEQLGKEVLSLPLFPTITADQVAYVAGTLLEAHEDAKSISPT